MPLLNRWQLYNTVAVRLAKSISESEKTRLEQLAEFVGEHSYESLPGDVQEQTRLAILNIVATAIGANAYDETRSLVAACAKIQDGSVPILGADRSAGPIAAAWANSAMSHFLDFDDTYLATVVHPGPPVVPGVISAGIDAGVDGKTAIYATAMGMETMIRLSHTIGLSETYSKWHNTSLYGTASTALATAVVMGADRDSIHSSVLQGLTVATGFLASKGTLTKSFQVGRSSAEGLISAIASMNGVTVPAKIMDMFSVSLSDSTDQAHLMNRIGKEWHVMKNYPKPYPCCVAIHPMIDAALEARKKGIVISEIEAITAHTCLFTAGAECIAEPKSGLESKFSPNHAIASALIHGPLFPENFTDSEVADKTITNLRRKVTLSAEEGINMGQTILDFRLKNGKKVTTEVNRGPDTPSKMLGKNDMKDKFSHLVNPVMGESRAKDIWDYFVQLDSKDDLSEIMELF